MAKLFNRAKMDTSTTGSGTITLGSAVEGYQSFADAGVADSDVVQYVIEDGSSWEIGTGTYSATGTSLTRTPSESSNAGAAISLTGAAEVFISAIHSDFERLQNAGTTKVEATSTGATVTGNLAVTGTVDGRDIASDGSKLDGIEAGATADQTKADIDALGINADQVDGLEASQFLRSDADDTATGNITFSNASGITIGEADIFHQTANTWRGITVKNNGDTNEVTIDGQSSDGTQRLAIYGETSSQGFLNPTDNSWKLRLPNSGSFTRDNTYTIWDSGNDGSGSGLDADTVDGLHESTFMRKSANSALDMNNYNITEVNHLQFNDPGPNEGLEWVGGNGWKIYESPDNLTTNGAGNLQFVTGSTSRGTLSTSGRFSATQLMAKGAGGYFFNDSGTRTAFTGGDLYIQSIGNYYNYATNQYHGNTSGDNHYFRGNTLSGNSWSLTGAGALTLGSGVTLQESTDRADLLQITSNTSIWGGLQIRNSSNEGRWSFMTDGSAAGIYDDENSDWHIYMVENAYVQLRYNSATKLQTTSTGVTVTGSLNATSDIRYKKNIETIDGALEKVKSLRGVTFDWDIDAFPVDENTKKPKFTERATGVIAQDVEKVLPEAVSENEETGFKNVAYGNMVGLLIEAIKEQQTQIDALTAQVEELKR